MERRFGRYIVTMTLGSGAMGEVFRARDERLGREVALKTVRNIFGVDPAQFRARFEAEARALAALSHPAIVQIHDLGIEGEEPYLVMELVDGPSLKGRLERGPMPAAEVRAMGIQLARALEAAHARSILHRDLKPANILRSSTGQWKLADFGVARVPESDLTLTGQFLGSPAYAAPESLTQGQFSDRSDVYGLAMTLVEAATGKKLRGSAGMSELIQKSGDDVVLPPEIEPGLAQTLRLAVSRDPARRPSAAQLAELLAAGTVAGPARRRLTIPLIAAGAGVLAIGVVVAVGSRDGSSPAASPALVIDARVDAPPPPPDAAPPIDAAPERPLPAIVPGRIMVIYPPDLDEARYQAYGEVVAEVRAERYGRALQYLDHYEQVYEATAQSRHLRAQIEAITGPRPPRPQ